MSLRRTRAHARRRVGSYDGSATQLVVDALAAYRLTRLANVDTFPAAVALRDRFTAWARDSGHPALDELVQCPWCIGFWIAAGVVATRASGVRGWDPLARALALSAASGVIAHYLSDDVVQVKPAESEMPLGVESLRDAR
jgi:hypothetical protein